MKDSRFAPFLLPYPYQIYAGKFVILVVDKEHYVFHL
jgi:hypothetical protein